MCSDTDTIGRAFDMRGNWQTQSKQLQKEFSELTDSDLHFDEGEIKALLRRIEKRLNKKRAEVIDLIKKFQPLKASLT